MVTVWSSCSQLLPSGGSFDIYKTAWQDRVQVRIHSPWEGTKAPWLCLMTKLLLFGLVWLLAFASSAFSISDWICSLTKVFLQIKGRQRTWRWMASVLGRPCRVLLHFISTVPLVTQLYSMPKTIFQNEITQEGKKIQKWVLCSLIIQGPLHLVIWSVCC